MKILHSPSQNWVFPNNAKEIILMFRNMTKKPKWVTKNCKEAPLMKTNIEDMHLMYLQ